MADFFIATAVSFAANFIISLFQPTRKVEGQDPNFRAPSSSYSAKIPKIYNTGRVAGKYVDPRKLEDIYEKQESTESQGGKGGGGTDVEKIETFGTAIAILAGGEYTLQQLYLQSQKKYDINATPTGQNFLDEYTFFASGSDTQSVWSVIQAIHDANNEASQTYRGAAFIGLDRLPLRGENFGYGDALPAIEAGIQTVTTFSLADIIADINDNAGIPSSKYDVSELTGITVRGFTARRGGESRADNLKALGQSYFIFPAKGTDGVVKWRSLQRPIAQHKTIPISDLASRPSGDERGFNWEFTRTPPDELPGRAIVRSLDPNKELDEGSTEIFYPVGDTENILEVNTFGVFTDAERETIGRRLLAQAWGRRDRYSRIFLTPFWADQLETGDVINLPISDTESRKVQIDIIKISAQDPPLVELECSSYDDSAFDQNYTTAIQNSDNQTITDKTTGSPATLYLLDIPKISNSDPDTILYVASDKSADIFVSRDSGDSFSGASTVATGLIASCDTTLGDAPTTQQGDAQATPFGLDGSGGIHYTPDTTNTLQVTTNGKPLTQLTQNEFEVFSNLAFVGRQVSGKWEGELIVFRDVTSLGGDGYEISHLIRGFAGTEQYSTGFHQSGETFILLRGVGSAIARLNGNQSDINQTLQFKARLEPFQDLASITPFSIQIEGNAAKPYTPVNLEISQNAAGDLFFNFLSRMRLEPFGFTGVFPDPASIFGTEKYELIITNGRTIEANSTTIIYPVEDQITDNGSAFSTVSGSLIQVNPTFGVDSPPANFFSVTPSSESTPPTITTVSGNQAGGELRIEGDNLTGTTAVTINGTAVSSFTVENDNLITATIAQGTTSGTLEVTTPAGTDTYELVIMQPLLLTWTEKSAGGAIALNGGDRIIADSGGAAQDLQLPDAPGDNNSILVYGKTSGSEVSSAKLTGSPVTIDQGLTYRFIYEPNEDVWLLAEFGGSGGGGARTDGEILTTNITLESNDHNKQYFADTTIEVTLPDSSVMGNEVVECSFVKKSGDYVRFRENSGVIVLALGRYQFDNLSKVRVQFFPTLGSDNNIYYLEGNLDYLRINICNNSAPSSLITETISLFLLTYSAEYNSVTYCNNSAPSSLITAT